MKTNLLLIGFLLVIGVACNTVPKTPDAKPTAKASPLPDAITAAKAEAAAALAAVERKVATAQAELAALEKRSAVAAAQVASAQSANTNQPPGPAAAVIAGETALALGNLPTPDVAAALEAEKRRAATFAGQADAARRLYAIAQSETDRMKSEAAKLRSDTVKANAEADIAKAKADAAQSALIAAERSHAADLERNKAENQALIAAAEKRANEAEEKARNERHKLIFRSLLGLGLACIAGAIAMAVLTSGAMLVKSLMLAGGGFLCIGLAQLISHVWFDCIAGACLFLAAVGGGFYLWNERRDALKRAAFEKQVAVMDSLDLEAIPVKREDGKPSNLATELSKAMNDPEKAMVKQIRLAQAVKSAKAEAKT